MFIHWLYLLWISKQTRESLLPVHKMIHHLILIKFLLVWRAGEHSSSFLCIHTVCHAAWMHRGYNFPCSFNVTFTIQSRQDALSHRCMRWIPKNRRECDQTCKTSYGIASIVNIMQLSSWMQLSNNAHTLGGKECHIALTFSQTFAFFFSGGLSPLEVCTVFY